MKRPQTMAVSSEIVESLSLVEFDTESGSFRATYDGTRDPTSLAVVITVATALEKEPETLPPLQSVIETDALDSLSAGSSSSGTCDSISFKYVGFDITVTSDGVIEANPLENT